MGKSIVPQYNQMLIPTMHALAALGGSGGNGELDAKAIEIMALTDEICNIRHKEESSVSEVSYRLAWARTYLKKYGVIANSVRGVWAFSENFDGDIASLDPQIIVQTVKEMSRPDEVSRDKYLTESTEIGEEEVDTEELHWRDKLRHILLEMPPNAFERLTLRILRESGFVKVEVTGKSNDHGIDGKGIISLNGIMSFHMIFQCKRYKNSVSPSEIRDFRGAMQGRADKGLFITTGTFTAEARREATRDGAPALDLIDGDALIDKLRDLGLGIEEKIIVEYAIKESWFEKI